MFRVEWERIYQREDKREYEVGITTGRTGTSHKDGTPECDCSRRRTLLKKEPINVPNEGVD